MGALSQETHPPQANWRSRLPPWVQSFLWSLQSWHHCFYVVSEAVKAYVKVKSGDCRGTQNSGSHLLNADGVSWVFHSLCGCWPCALGARPRPPWVSTGMSSLWWRNCGVSSSSWVLSTQYSLSLHLSPALQSWYYLAHFTDVKTMAQKGLVLSPSSPSQ